MPFKSKIGEPVKIRAETHVEWQIRDFSSLSDNADDEYRSPVFQFAGVSWFLSLYPNGMSDDSSESVAIVLVRKNSGEAKTIFYSLGIKGLEKEEEEEIEYTFSRAHEGFGDVIVSRSALSNRMSTLLPNDVMTILCHLRNYARTSSVKVSRSNNFWEVSLDMKTILAEGKRADFTLKLGDREWPVHKLILENRSDYFANKFRHEWAENAVGEVTFADMQADALDSVLEFLYTGNVEKMSVDNVCEIYVAADKFLLDNLNELCIEWMKENMCVEIVCKLLVIADTYGVGILKQLAADYIIEEADQIFDSDEWKEWERNNVPIAAEILKETTKRLRKKRMKT